MSLNENVAYLKGLAEGLGVDSEAKEGKLFLGIIDTLSIMAKGLEELGENSIAIGEELEAISDSLADVEEYIFDNDEEDDDDEYYDFRNFGVFDDDDSDECDCEYCSGHDFSLEVECPNCGADIELGDPDLSSGTASCTACGEEFDLEFDDWDSESETVSAE